MIEISSESDVSTPVKPDVPEPQKIKQEMVVKR